MIRRLWIFCLFLYVFNSCEGNVAGGTSEHENVIQVQRLVSVRDSVLAVVLDSRGSPIPYAVVQVAERRNWAAKTEKGEKIVRDSAFVADKDGIFSVDSGLCAHVGLIVAHGKGLGYAQCAQAGSILKIEVKKPLNFFGKAQANQIVAAYGTGFFTRSDRSGRWRLPLPENLGRDDIVLLEDGSWHLLEENSGRIVVDNFSDANSSFTRLHRFNGGGRWRMDTLFFAAKGAGIIRVQFVCRAENLLKNTVFETKVTLDSSWTDYALPIERFKVASGSTLDASYSWEEVSRHCKATVFYADGPADLWLDDIAIHGALLKDIE